MSVKTFLYLCCIFTTHCHVLDYFRCNHVSVAMRGIGARDKYGHEYSVNEQRGPIVYNQSKHETMGEQVQTKE